jgi:large subunit ribosomal protein L18
MNRVSTLPALVVILGSLATATCFVVPQPASGSETLRLQSVVAPVVGNKVLSPVSEESGWGLSSTTLGLLGLCAAMGTRVLGSSICRFGRKRTPNRPTNWEDERLGYRIHGAPGWPGSPHHYAEPIRWCNRFKTRIHIRRKVEGTCVRPRLAVFRSHQHLHANVVDDTTGTGVTLVTVTTKQRDNLERIREKQGVEKGQEKTWSIEAAEVVGTEIAKRCLEKNITMVVFDRGGFPYEGRVKALAEAARSGGLQF